MDRARARFRKALMSGEKATETLQEAQAALEEEQQEVVQGQQDVDRLMQEPPDTYCTSPTHQWKLGQILGSFDGYHRKHVEPRCGCTTSLASAIQHAKVLIQASSEVMAQEGSAAQAEDFTDVGDEDVHGPDGAPSPGQATGTPRTRPSDRINEVQHAAEHRDPAVQETVHKRIRPSTPRTAREGPTISCSRVPCRTPGTPNSQSSPRGRVLLLQLSQT